MTFSAGPRQPSSAGPRRPRQPASAGPRPWTLAVDCGGTRIKAVVVDAAGFPVAERVRVFTPYPCPPDVLAASVVSLAVQLPAFDRASVGVPGVVRHGRVLATPHYVTQAGPFTTRRADLVAAWSGFDVRAALETALQVPTRVVNDAEVVALSVCEGSGVEVVMTLGTGLGFAMLDDGRLLPKIEMSHAPFRAGKTYDRLLGDRARRKVGNEVWTERVLGALDALRPVLWWDHGYLGGGNTKHLTAPLPSDVVAVPNVAGLLGGVRLWEPSRSGP